MQKARQGNEEPDPPTAGAAPLTAMLGPSRPLPCVGAHARIKHFGGAAEAGTIVAVNDEGRSLRVRGEDGELHEFVLSAKNARFVSAEDAHGSRLELVSDS